MNNFSIEEIISSAWKNVRNIKWPIWLALIVLVLIGLGVSLIAGLVTMLIGIPVTQAAEIGITASTGAIIGVFIIVLVFEIIGIFLITPLTAGIQMTALKKIRGEAVSATTGFGYWNKWFRLGLTVLLFTIGNLIVHFFFTLLSNFALGSGLMWLSIIFNIAGLIAVILYCVFFIFNVLFVTDQDKGPWAALGYSARAVAPHWFKVLLLFIYIGILLVVAALPGILSILCPYVWVKVIGVLVSIFLLIWVIPYIHAILSTIYNKLSTR